MAGSPVAQLHLNTAIRQGLQCRTAEEFQTIVQNILRQRLPEFTSVVPHGRDGDGGNDGYSRPLGIYAQVYAPKSSRLPGRYAARKAAEDFGKLKRKWSSISKVKEYWFITNSEGSNIHVESALKTIEKKHRIKARFLGSQDLATEVAALPPARISELMGFTVLENQHALGYRVSQVDMFASLTRSQLAGLHLLAALTHPVPPKLCEELLPAATNWNLFWPWLLNCGWGRKLRDLIELDAQIVDQCRKNRAEQLIACEQWATALVGYGSIDCLYLAVVPLITLGRTPDAIRAITRAGLEFADSGWDSSILVIAGMLAKSDAARQLSSSEKLAFKIALASLLARTNRQEAALRAYAAILRAKGKWPNELSRGQVILNYGVAAYQSGQADLAKRLYEQAVVWSRRNRDLWTFGRAATNLAQMLDASDVDASEELIDAAEQSKRRCRDATGLVAIEMVRAEIAIARDDPSRANEHYERAERMAKRVGHVEALSDIYFNRGKSYGELARWKEAASYHRRSAVESKTRGDIVREARARSGLAEALFQCGNLRLCRDECDLLAKLPDDEGLANFRLTGLHGLMVLESPSAPSERAERLVAEALGAAKAAKDEEWIGRILVDSHIGYDRGDSKLQCAERLLELGKAEERARHHAAAAYVFRSLWQWGVLQKGLDSELEDQAEGLFDRLLERKLKSDEAIDALKWKYEALIRFGRPWRALEVLDTLAARARGASQWNEYTCAVDQHGVCLQQLGQPAKAEGKHREALRIATRFRLSSRMQISLGNLAECLRRLGKYEDAHRMSAKALRLYDQTQDPEGYISALHNHYLIEHALGRSSAWRVLRKCEALAKRHGLAHATVKALMARGNAAADRRDLRLAKRLYRSALKQAKKAGLQNDMADCRYNLALTLRKTGHVGDALRVLGSSTKSGEVGVDQMHRATLTALLLEDAGKLRGAGQAWENAKQVASEIGDLRSCIYYDARRKLLNTPQGGDARSRAALADCADQLITNIQESPESRLQRHFDSALAFFDKNKLVGYRVLTYRVLAERLRDGEKPKSLVKAAQASIASIITACSDRNSLELGLEAHGGWLAGLKIGAGKIKWLKERTRSWLLRQTNDSMDPRVVQSLLFGFDILISRNST